VLFTIDDSKNTVQKPVEKLVIEEKIDWVHSQPSVSSEGSATLSSTQNQSNTENNSPAPAASGGYLAKPSNIYAESTSGEPVKGHPPVKAPVNDANTKKTTAEEPAEEMQLVFKDDNTIPAAEESGAHQTTLPVMATAPIEEPAMQDEVGEQKRRAAERIQKLRNLSFNINAADPNNEFETVPAYIRRNLELYNTISNVENFYSNYEVKTDENNNTQISTINTFLDGKKPD
jgi:cell division protein FtsZ